MFDINKNALPTIETEGLEEAQALMIFAMHNSPNHPDCDLWAATVGYIEAELFSRLV